MKRAVLRLALATAACIAPAAAFEVGPPLDVAVARFGDVAGVAALPDGGLVVFGDFDQVGPLRRRAIAALDANGTTQARFDADCRPLLVNGERRRCRIHQVFAAADGSLLVTGSYAGFGDVLRTGPTKLDASSGMPDPGWNPPVEGAVVRAVIGSQVLLSSSAEAGWVRSVELAGAGGRSPGFVPLEAPSWLGHNQRDTLFLARRDGTNWRVHRADAASGRLDPDWRSRAFGAVTGMAYDPASDDLFIAGTEPGVGYGGVGYLVRMQASGPASEVPEWRDEQGLRRIETLVVRDGHLFAQSYSSGSGGARVLRFDLQGNGYPDPAYVAAHEGSRLLALDGAGRVLLHRPPPTGSAILQTGSTLLRLTPAGALDMAFRPAERLDAGIEQATRAANGRIALSGNDDAVNGTRTRGLFRLAPDYRFDPGWSPFVRYSSPFQGEPRSRFALDRMGRAYQATSAVFDDSGSSFPPHFLRIGADGQPDTAWNASGRLDGTVAWTLGSGVRDILLDEAGGWLYVGGHFDAAICGQRRRHLARVSLASPCSADPAWNPDPDAPVDVLAMDGSGRLYVGGQFERIAGTDMPALVRFDSFGLDTGWRPLSAGPVGYRATKLAVDGANVFAAIAVTPAGGLASEGLFRFDAATGARDEAWQPAAAREVAALLLTQSGQLVSSRRGVVSAYGRDMLEQFDPAGGGVPRAGLPLEPGQRIDALVQGIEPDAVLVAGYFDTLGGKARRAVAELLLEPRSLFQDGFD